MSRAFGNPLGILQVSVMCMCSCYSAPPLIQLYSQTVSISIMCQSYWICLPLKLVSCNCIEWCRRTGTGRRCTGIIRPSIAPYLWTVVHNKCQNEMWHSAALLHHSDVVVYNYSFVTSTIYRVFVRISTYPIYSTNVWLHEWNHSTFELTVLSFNFLKHAWMTVVVTMIPSVQL